MIDLKYQADEHGHMLRIFIRVPAVLPELIDLGGELVDPLVALAQQDFESGGVALRVSELLAQLQELGAERSIGLLQLNFVEAGRAGGSTAWRLSYQNFYAFLQDAPSAH